MAFATTTDVGKRLGRELTENEVESVTFLLDAATAVIANAADKSDDWAAELDPVPRILRFVAVEVTCRALANPNSLQSLQESIGQASKSARFHQTGLMLTDTEELLVRREVYGTTSGSSRPSGPVEELHDFYYTGS